MTEPKNRPAAAYSRRQFIRFSSLAGSACALGSTSASAFVHFARRYPSEHRSIIVVGSGFGGAITAHGLTHAGMEVTLIEQGRRWDQKLPPGTQRFSKNLYPDGRSTWLSNKTVIPLGPALPINRSTGVLQGRQLAGKTVLNGAAYGGGSITWGGVLVKPEERVFRQVFPEEVDYDELAPYYEQVGKKLNRSTLPDDLAGADCYQHVRVVKKQCERAGLKWEAVPTGTDWNIVRDELAGRVPRSITIGEAPYGVNSGAKASVDRSWLAEAEATGRLEVRTLHQVEDISRDEAGRYVLELKELNEDGDVIAYRTFTCDKLFLAAGCVTTSSLLVKAKAKGRLPQLNAEVGHGWGNNGNVYALRLGILEPTGQWQGGPPAVGINQLDHPLTPLFIEHPQLPVGVDIFGLLFFAIGITPTRGVFRYVPESDEVRIDWPEHDAGQEKINAALLDVLARMNKANGGFTTSLLTYLKDKVKDDICYHPLGGMVMGKACDFYGRVKGYEGLYVNDGSLLPGSSACTNPSMTISAFALRNIERILAEDF